MAARAQGGSGADRDKGTCHFVLQHVSAFKHPFPGKRRFCGIFRTLGVRPREWDGGAEGEMSVGGTGERAVSRPGGSGVQSRAALPGASAAASRSRSIAASARLASDGSLLRAAIRPASSTRATRPAAPRPLYGGEGGRAEEREGAQQRIQGAVEAVGDQPVERHRIEGGEPLGFLPALASAMISAACTRA